MHAHVISDGASAEDDIAFEIVRTRKIDRTPCPVYSCVLYHVELTHPMYPSYFFFFLVIKINSTPKINDVSEASSIKG